MAKYRIMFVCHGNICRSPMAEFIMKDLVKKKGLDDDFYIASSATSTEEIWNGIGNPIYRPAQSVLMRNNIPFDNRQAVQLKSSDYDLYDFFIGMDSSNIRNMNRILCNDCQKKIYKLMSFTGKDSDVSDPWYSGDFDTAYNDIYRGCCGLLDYLLGE